MSQTFAFLAVHLNEMIVTEWWEEPETQPCGPFGRGFTWNRPP